MTGDFDGRRRVANFCGHVQVVASPYAVRTHVMPDQDALNRALERRASCTIHPAAWPFGMYMLSIPNNLYPYVPADAFSGALSHGIMKWCAERA